MNLIFKKIRHETRLIQSMPWLQTSKGWFWSIKAIYVLTLQLSSRRRHCILDNWYSRKEFILHYIKYVADTCSSYVNYLITYIVKNSLYLRALEMLQFKLLERTFLNFMFALIVENVTFRHGKISVGRKWMLRMSTAYLQRYAEMIRKTVWSYPSRVKCTIIRRTILLITRSTEMWEHYFENRTVKEIFENHLLVYIWEWLSI